MRYSGLTNPLPIIGGVVPMYIFYRVLTESPFLDKAIHGGPGDILLLIFFTAVCVIGPLTLLLFCKLILVDKDTITLIYPLRLKTIKYGVNELKSVYRQVNNEGKLSFSETHLYFGSDRRIKFNSFEILNFDGLSNKLEALEGSRGPQQ
jgi:hypothetical protein